LEVWIVGGWRLEVVVGVGAEDEWNLWLMGELQWSLRKMTSKKARAARHVRLSISGIASSTFSLVEVVVFNICHPRGKTAKRR
jgi:hypothetical protein